MGEADGSKVFDLAVEYFIGMPTWTPAGDPPFEIWMSHTPNGNIAEDFRTLGPEVNRLVSYSGDCVAMYTHSGTHVDTLNHFGYNGRIWNGFTATDHLGSRHWQVAGAEKHPAMIARGVLIDVAGSLDTDVLPPSFGIGSKELIDALRRQATAIRPGDVVMVRTGRMRLWPNPDYLPNEPGLNLEGAQFLARAGAMVIGADNIALEQMPTTDEQNYNVVHTYLLAEAGVPIMEVVNLEELAVEAVYEFAFFGACIRLRGATGSPVRPLAFPLRRHG